MGSPPLAVLVAVDEAGDDALRLAQGLRPAVEQAPALHGELVRALGGPGKVGAPLRRDDSLLLESAQNAVEVSDVDARLAARNLGEPLDQLVPLHRALA